MDIRVSVKYSHATDTDIRLENSNKSQLLPVFFVHYCLGTFFQENPKVSIATRIRTISLWKRLDPEGAFFSIKDYRYRYGVLRYQEPRKNLLPLTFDAGLVEDQAVADGDFYKNKVILKVFGKPGGMFRPTWEPGEFQKGLQLLFTDYKQEFAQVLHSLIQLNPDNHLGQMQVRFIFKLVEYDDLELFGLVLGGHASYRNKGRVTLVADDLSHLSRELLLETARSQRHRIAEMDSCRMEAEKASFLKLNQLKSILVQDRAQSLICTLDPMFDFKGYFRVFYINPMLSFEVQQEFINHLYQKLALTLHPDKHPDASEEEKVELASQMAFLSEAKAVLTNPADYHEYFEVCLTRATAIATQQIESRVGPMRGSSL